MARDSGVAEDVQKPVQEGTREVNGSRAVERLRVTVGDRYTASMVGAGASLEIVEGC